MASVPILGFACIGRVLASNRLETGGPRMAASGPSAPLAVGTAMVQVGAYKGDAIYPAWGDAASPDRV
jgi:hypothetical protein